MESSRQPTAAPNTDIGAKARRRRRRLRKRCQFDYVKRHGNTAVGRCCVLQIAPAQDGHMRSAIVVSRYFSSSAVERNRVRRVIREAVRELLADCPEQWIVIRPRKAMRRAKTDQVREELKAQLGKLDLPTHNSQS